MVSEVPKTSEVFKTSEVIRGVPDGGKKVQARFREFPNACRKLGEDFGKVRMAAKNSGKVSGSPERSPESQFGFSGKPRRFRALNKLVNTNYKFRSTQALMFVQRSDKPLSFGEGFGVR
jgi:hypothetical protein